MTLINASLRQSRLCSRVFQSLLFIKSFSLSSSFFVCTDSNKLTEDMLPVTCFISHSKIRHPNVTTVKFHSAGKSPLLCSNHWSERMASKIAGSWIFVVAQVLRRFEYLLKSPSDGHANLLYVCYASLGKTLKGKLKPRAIPFQLCTVQTLMIS